MVSSPPCHGGGRGFKSRRGRIASHPGISHPLLIAVAHGTVDPAGIDEITRLLALVRSQRPALRVRLCWLDRAEPSLADTLASVNGPAVIVPILLSTGYHVRTDIPAIIAGREATILTAPLGPDPRLAHVVYERLYQARERGGIGSAASRRSVLIAAGSSDPAARGELATVARKLAALTTSSVAIGQLTDPDPLAAAEPGDDVANYLLAPGYFNDVLHGLAVERGAVIGDPIGAHPLVAEVILDRFDSAVTALGLSSPDSRKP